MEEMEDGDEKEMWEPSDDEKKWMMEANLAFLTMAGELFFVSLMDLTSWRWANVVEQTNADGDTEDVVYDFTNEWTLVDDGELGMPLYKWASMMQTYTGVAVGGAMFVTQLLSMVGIAASVNMMVWGYGGMILSLVGFLWGAMTFFNHWFSWILLKSEVDADETIGSLDTDSTAAFALTEQIEWEWLRKSAHGSGAALTAWAYGEAWMVAQWWALPEEERMAAWEAMEEENKEDDMGKKGKKMMLNRLF